MNEPITWNGDLDDDCSCDLGDIGAHCEAMSDNDWYCSVYPLPWTPNSNREDIFHSTDWDIMPKTGDAARKLCEFIIRAARAGVRIEKTEWLKSLGTTGEDRR